MPNSPFDKIPVVNLDVSDSDSASATSSPVQDSSSSNKRDSGIFSFVQRRRVSQASNASNCSVKSSVATISDAVTNRSSLPPEAFEKGEEEERTQPGRYDADEVT